VTNLSDGVQEELVEASPQEGQAADTFETSDQAPEAAPEPVREYLEIDDDIGSKWVKVKIDGEESDVQVKDLPQGYQRHEVFTRKTQEAAALREQANEALRLQQAFQADPGLTVQVLARQAGVSVEQFLGMTPRQQEAATQAVEDEYADPLEKAIAQERNERIALQERLDQRDADEYLRAQVQGLKQTYQIGDEEVRSVIQQAIQMGVGPEAFPMIYQSQAFLRLQAQTAAQQEATAAQAADDERRRAAAAAATGVVTSGSGATNVTTAPPANVHISPRDAVLAAFEQLGA
jgi:negative regulator of genetic competence, sporulation and motility